MEIVPNVHLIPGVRGVNAYLLTGTTPALVDTGMASSAQAILRYMAGLGLTPAGLGHIVLTHYHVDHTGSLAALKQGSAARVAAHAADEPFITHAQLPPPPESASMRLLFTVLGVLPMLRPAAPAPVDDVLQNGDHLELLGGATVVHVPGHTPGSIALHLPAERVLFCGDAITRHGDRLDPAGKLATVDMAQARASLQRMAALDCDVLCLGHGQPWVGGAGDQLRALVRRLA